MTQKQMAFTDIITCLAKCIIPFTKLGKNGFTDVNVCGEETELKGHN